MNRYQGGTMASKSQRMIFPNLAVEDLERSDGHQWEIFWMDISVFEQTPAGSGAAA
jgi:hypothetical protein